MNSVGNLLHSDAPMVLIEAAAGCGKTWAAANYAKEIAPRLNGKRVLLLSHTHAACGEFHRRCDVPGIEVDTCDSFALKVAAPYAQALGLPYPLVSSLGRADGVSFSTVSEKAADLVERSPTIACLISAQYPVIILDEHQDASSTQHRLVEALRRAGGSRVRIFGDPMQALHFSPADFVDWDALKRNCDSFAELTEPHRWKDAPELGNWITAARKTLSSGGAVSFSDAPREVQFRRIDGLAGRNKLKDHQRASEMLRGFFDASPKGQRSVVLAYLTDMVWALAQAAGWRVTVNEGATLDHLSGLLEMAESSGADRASLASAFMDFVEQIGSGLRKPMRESILRRAGAQLNVDKAGLAQRPWLDALSPIYELPNHRGLAAAMERLAAAPPSQYKIRLKDHAVTLRALGRTTDPRGHLQALGRLRRIRRASFLSASTVHKAKGLEFHRVMICPADTHQYPNGGLGGRLLYVAMSRATQELLILGDGSNHSPHLGQPEELQA